MATVNQEALLGSLIPNVYVKKITLVTSGDVLPKESNPHIDSEREPDVVRNPPPPHGDGKLVRQERSVDLFRKNTSATPLSIRLDIILKEKLDKSVVASWFGEQNLLKYLKIRVVQSQDEKFTKLFATKRLPLGQTAFKDIDIELEEAAMNEPVVRREIKTAKKRRIDNKIISIQSVLTDSALDQYYSYVDDEGNTIYDVTFPVTFKIMDSNPQHLSYFVVSFLDLEELAKDFNLDLPVDADKTLNGRIASELVIKDYELFSESYVFRTETGEIWTGDVHQVSDGRWKTGGANDTDSKFVELITLPNQKLQDFRNVKEIEKMQIDFSIMENDLFSTSKKMKFESNARLDVERKNTYFSECFVSRDLAGDARFAFSIDYQKLLRENTTFGSLFRNDNEELLDYAKIRSLKVLRARVKNDSAAGLKDDRGLRIFDEQEEPTEIIIFSGETDPKMFKTARTSKGSLREIKIFLEKDSPGVRHFTGIDKSMNTVSFGQYQYGIEIEVEDKTSSYLLFRLDGLLAAHRVLIQYYNEASIPKNYDLISNQFNEAFIKRLEEKYAGNEHRSPWIDCVSAYLSVMDILIKEFTVEKYSKTFTSYVHPRSANPESILMVLKLIEDLATKLASIVGTTVSGQVNKFIPGQNQFRPQSTLARGGVSIKTFKVEKFFTTIFDSDMPKKVGYDFLSIDEGLAAKTNDDGLLVVSNGKFKSRTEKETLKYFTSMDAQIDLNTQKVAYTKNDSLENTRYSFLSPSAVNLGTTTKPISLLNQGTSMDATNSFKTMASTIVRHNASFKSPYVPFFQAKVSDNTTLLAPDQITRTNLSTVLSERNLTVSSNPTRGEYKTTQITADTSQEANPMVDAKVVLGETSLMTKENMVTTEQSPAIAEKKAQTDVSPNKLLLDVANQLINTGVNSTLNLTKKQESDLSITNTSAFFNLNSPMNALDNNKVMEAVTISKPVEVIAASFSKTPTFLDTQQKLSDPTVNEKRDQFVKSLPNQIKSLFVASVNESSVVSVLHTNNATSDALKDPELKLGFKMNYNILSRIEYLSGFTTGTNEEANLYLKEPIWKILTAEVFNQSVNKNLFCRLKEYQEKLLKIEFPKGLAMPIFNEYFVLSPEDRFVDPPPAPVPTKAEKATLINLGLNEVQINVRPEYIGSLVTAQTMFDPALAQNPTSEIRPVNTRTEVPITRNDVATMRENISNPASLLNSLTNVAQEGIASDTKVAFDTSVARNRLR